MIEGYLLFETRPGKQNQRTRRALERVVEFYQLWGKPEQTNLYHQLLTDSM
jgi:hypothetical protein